MKSGNFSFFKNWIGHKKLDKTFREVTFMPREITLGGNNGGEEGARPRQKFMDWMIEDGYGELKKEAQRRDSRSMESLDMWTVDLPGGGYNPTKVKTCKFI